MLNELQKDVLGEIVNVYIGQAASLLSEMTGQEIRLNVPQVLLLASGEATEFVTVFGLADERGPDAPLYRTAGDVMGRLTVDEVKR